MANYGSIPPDTQGAVGWIESQVDEWVHARIRGEEWTPGPVPPHPSIIRKAQVFRRTGPSHVSIWKMERAGRFPRRIRLTEVAHDAA